MVKHVVGMLLLGVMVGCVTPKDWAAISGSRDGGTVKLGYQYGAFESPQLDEQQALTTAIRRCTAWGYQGAEAFGADMKSCISYSTGAYGGCNVWQVTREYQCLNNN